MAVSPSIWKAMMMMYCQCNMVNTWWNLYSIWIWMKWCRLVVFSGYWRFTVSCSFQITQSFRGLSFSPFLWPKAARDAHFEQTSALFRWAARNIEIFFSPKFGELCWPDMETFGTVWGEIFGGRELHRSNETNPRNPRHPSPTQTGSFWETRSLNQSCAVEWTEWCIYQGFVMGGMVKKVEHNQGAFVLSLLYFSTFQRWHPVFWLSAPITLFCWPNKRKRALGGASNKGPQRQNDSVKNLTTDPCSDQALLCSEARTIQDSGSTYYTRVHSWVWRTEFGGVGTAQ